MKVLLSLCCLLLIIPAASLAQDEKKKELLRLEKLDGQVSKLKKEYEKRGKMDAKLKANYAEALFMCAEGYMYTTALGPKDKYPKALRHYRESLKIDPKHKDHQKAQKSIETIESIYKSMGKKIPEG